MNREAMGFAQTSTPSRVPLSLLALHDAGPKAPLSPEEFSGWAGRVLMGESEAASKAQPRGHYKDHDCLRHPRRLGCQATGERKERPLMSCIENILNAFEYEIMWAGQGFASSCPMYRVGESSRCPSIM